MLYAITMITNSIWFEVAAKPSESDSRSETFSRRRASEFSPQARFPCYRVFSPQANFLNLTRRVEFSMYPGDFVRSAHECCFAYLPVK